MPTELRDPDPWSLFSDEEDDTELNSNFRHSWADHSSDEEDYLPSDSESEPDPENTSAQDSSESRSFTTNAGTLHSAPQPSQDSPRNIPVAHESVCPTCGTHFHSEEMGYANSSSQKTVPTHKTVS